MSSETSMPWVQSPNLYLKLGTASENVLERLRESPRSSILGMQLIPHHHINILVGDIGVE